MGFLKNMIRNKISEGIGKGISDAVGKAVEKVVTPAAEKLAGKAADNINETADAIGESTEALKENRGGFADAMKKLEEASKKYEENVKAAVEEGAKYMDGDASDHGSAAYFEAIISKNLPELEILKHVPYSAASADVPEKAAPIDLLLLKDGNPVVGILLVPKNSYDTVAIRNTMALLEKKGTTPLRFMKEFSNEEGYVVSRIKAVL